jgi:hypothetical protein
MSHSIQLSPELYRILQQQAVALNATIESLVESAVRRNYGHASVTKPNGSAKGQGSHGISNATDSTNWPKSLTDELEQLAFLTDDELWQAARTRLNKGDHRRMEALLHKQQATDLRPDEITEAEMLADRFDRALLIRAKAAVLLKERGHDISSLGPNPS